MRNKKSFKGELMSFCSDLNNLFPKYSMEYCRDNISIKETSAQSKVKELIWSNSCFQCIDATIVKDMTSFFQKAGSSDIFHNDCDGITIFEENGKKYLFLSELKSTFDSNDIFHAREQIISSYIKISMLMHLLRCYNKEDFIAKGFIVNLSPNENYLRDMYRAQFLNRGNNYREESDFILKLCYGKEKKTVLKSTDCYKLKTLPLGDKCLFNEMELYYIEVPEKSSSIKLDVHDYI